MNYPDTAHPRRFSLSGAPLQASKWQQIQLLVDGEELAHLFEALGEFRIYAIGRALGKDALAVSRDAFLERYGAYVALLQKGETPEDQLFRQLFSVVFTVAADHLLALEVPPDRCVLKVLRPCVQLQLHCFGYSPLDAKFRPMVFGQGSVHWGLQLSYPQLFQDPATYQVENVRETEAFPNTYLFKSLQKWVRSNTVPTPFEREGGVENVPIRLGKQCFSWINNHPQLAAKHIKVARGKNAH